MEKIKGIIDVLKENNATKPPILYKYYSFNKWTQRIFESNEIYFSSPESFNDPFDSKIKFFYKCSNTKEKQYFREWVKNNRPDLSRKQLLEYEKRIIKEGIETYEIVEGAKKDFVKTRKQMGVFCMTEKKDNILMWSHYTDDHKGLCLGFNTENSFFSNARPIIQYSKDLPSFNLADLLDLSEPNRKLMLQKGVNSLLTKAEDWDYEKEWRIVEINGVGVKNFPEDALECVILGCKISSENKKKIIEWCSSHNTQPALYEAKEKESEFGLDIIPIS